MIEDKLNKDERIRLESLAQANASLMEPSTIIDRAKDFEKYIRGESDAKS